MRVRHLALWIGIAGLLIAGYGYRVWTHGTGEQNGLSKLAASSGQRTSPNREPLPDAQPNHTEKPDSARPFFALPKLQPKSFLILGIDSRAGEPARSDTIMLAVLDPERKTANVIPIPRDTYVKVPGHGSTKINHAMAFGGPPLIKRTVEEWLNTPVHHTVVVDFKGFERLVDLLGGLSLNVEKNMDYDDPSDGTHIHLRAGPQVLNGKQALDYSRFRNDPEADTGRMRRQQQVLRAMLDKAVSLDTLPKIFAILDILGDHLQSSVTPGEAFLLAKSYRDFDAANLHTETVKGLNKVAPRDRLWYFFVEKDEQERLRRLLADWLRGN